MKKIAALALGILVAAAAFTQTRDARAENEFDVTISGGTITVTAKGDYHINKEFPWKVTVGSEKLGKGKFSLGETSASVSGVPKGSGMLKGAVCAKSTCVPFEKPITIK
jgi:hypothetical protein